MTAPMPPEVTAARDVIEPALRRAVDELTPAMRRIARYHFGWADEHGNDTPGNSGKALRPALTLLSAQAITTDPGLAVPAAVAVELVHKDRKSVV